MEPPNTSSCLWDLRKDVQDNIRKNLVRNAWFPKKTGNISESHWIFQKIKIL